MPPTAPARTTTSTTFRDVMAQHGHTTNTQIAAAIGVDPSTVGRILRGITEPSAAFIAGAIRATGARFEDLFTVQ